MARRNEPPTKFRVGQWVTYTTWPHRSLARVIERRGPLGIGGEQIYRIRHVDEWGEVREFEQSESSLQPADEPTPAT